jgi:ABC-type bacteriocin/lantibiotic exporter with double-glycine peptidase domain
LGYGLKIILRTAENFMPCKYGHTHQHIKQETQETCSTACIEMVCKRRGADLEYNGFQTNFYNGFKSKDKDKPGLNQERISSILRGLGIQSKVIDERNPDKAGSLLRESELPVIAEVLYSSKNKELPGLHWVVVDGRKASSQTEFCILDPSADDVIYTSIPKTGLASYQLSADLLLMFSGRMVQVGT